LGGICPCLGARAFTVDHPAQLEATFRTALAANATVLIDVKADRNCPTPVYDFAAGARAWSYHE
jgi:thiamine pyrophosphate-dependent acetolactate synthase large subunit-like protein